jgi:hypothetical protein
MKSILLIAAVVFPIVAGYFFLLYRIQNKLIDEQRKLIDEQIELIDVQQANITEIQQQLDCKIIKESLLVKQDLHLN